MLGGVAQSLFDKLRRFVCADGIADRVLAANVDHRNDRRTVVVNRHAFFVGCLIHKFHIPAVKRPELQRVNRCFALHLHSLVVAVCRDTVTACVYDIVEFVAPHGDGTGTDFLPHHLFGQHVVEARHLFVVEVARVAHQNHQSALLVVVGNLRGVLVLCLVCLVYEAFRAFVDIFLVFALEASRVGWQGVRVNLGVKGLHTLRNLIPEARRRMSQSRTLRMAVGDKLPDAVENDGVGVILAPFVRREVTAALDDVFVKEMCRLRRLLNAVFNGVCLGCPVRIGHQLQNLRLEPVRKAVESHQRRCARTASADNVDVATVT